MLVSSVSLGNNYQNRNQTNFEGLPQQRKLGKLLNAKGFKKALADSKKAGNLEPLDTFLSQGLSKFVKFIEGDYQECPNKSSTNKKFYQSINNPGEELCISVNPVEHAIECVERISGKRGIKRTLLGYIADKNAEKGDIYILKRKCSGPVYENEDWKWTYKGNDYVLSPGGDSFMKLNKPVSGIEYRNPNLNF